jgi:hypothetical protein
MYTHWVLEISLMLGAINAFYVQMFFVHRLWASGSMSYLLRCLHTYSAPRQYLEIHILSSSASLCSQLGSLPPPPRYVLLGCAQLALINAACALIELLHAEYGPLAVGQPLGYVLPIAATITPTLLQL